MQNLSCWVLGHDYDVNKEKIYRTRVMKITGGKVSGNIKFLDGTTFPLTVTIKYYKNDSEEPYDYIVESYTTMDITGSDSPGIMISAPNNTRLVIIGEFDKTSVEDGSEPQMIISYVPADLAGQSNANFIMYESKSGLPYVQHEIGSYSEYEFAQKTGLTGRSVYMGKRMASPILIGHFHENERGFLRNIYAVTRWGKSHKNVLIKNKTIAGEESDYIYLDLLDNTIDIFEQSNRVIRSILMKTKE